MRLLLDTHTLLWFLADAPDLSPPAREALVDAGNEALVSVASLWEIAIKLSLGKLELLRPFDEVIPAELDRNAISVVPILPAHLQRLIRLPFHHRDPFDRLIAAQSLVEDTTLLSRDPVFNDYGCKIRW
jgi:PIN domain nuclease of toxin-antitoxin system